MTVAFSFNKKIKKGTFPEHIQPCLLRSKVANVTTSRTHSKPGTPTLRPIPLVLLSNGIKGIIIHQLLNSLSIQDLL